MNSPSCVKANGKSSYKDKWTMHFNSGVVTIEATEAAASAKIEIN